MQKADMASDPLHNNHGQSKVTTEEENKGLRRAKHDTTAVC